jgi:hypothetical protein
LNFASSCWDSASAVAGSRLIEEIVAAPRKTSRARKRMMTILKKRVTMILRKRIIDSCSAEFRGIFFLEFFSLI